MQHAPADLQALSQSHFCFRLLLCSFGPASLCDSELQVGQLKPELQLEGAFAHVHWPVTALCCFGLTLKSNQHFYGDKICIGLYQMLNLHMNCVPCTV